MKLKLLVLFLLSMSLNVFAVDVGEDQKSECIYAVQSGRSNTPAVTTETETEVEKPKSTSR